MKNGQKLEQNQAKIAKVVETRNRQTRKPLKLRNQRNRRTVRTVKTHKPLGCRPGRSSKMHERVTAELAEPTKCVNHGAPEQAEPSKCVERRAGERAVLTELGVVKIRVVTAFMKELLVSPLFDYVAVLHHKDEVGVFDGREAVGDYEARAPFH